MGIIVLKEGNQGCSYGCNLLRRNVHVIHLGGRNHRIIIVLTTFHLGADECTIIIERSITLTDNLTFLFFGSHVLNTILRQVYHTIVNLSVGCLDESQIVDLGKHTQ